MGLSLDFLLFRDEPRARLSGFASAYTEPAGAMFWNPKHPVQPHARHSDQAEVPAPEGCGRLWKAMDSSFARLGPDCSGFHPRPGAVYSGLLRKGFEQSGPIRSNPAQSGAIPPKTTISVYRNRANHEKMANLGGQMPPIQNPKSFDLSGHGLLLSTGEDRNIRQLVRSAHSAAPNRKSKIKIRKCVKANQANQSR